MQPLLLSDEYNYLPEGRAISDLALMVDNRRSPKLSCRCLVSRLPEPCKVQHAAGSHSMVVNVNDLSRQVVYLPTVLENVTEIMNKQ